MQNMQIQNNLLKRLCCHQVVLSPVSNHASPSPATLKSSCASANNIGLIDGTAELTMEVRCDDRTQQDLIGMLTEPTYCGLWITWKVFNVRLQLVLFIQSRPRYIQFRFMKTVLWLKCSMYMISMRMNWWNTLLMTR
jgi:hypothetical protein